MHIRSAAANLKFVMPGLVPGIHAFEAARRRGDKDVDGRDKPGHDDRNRGLADASGNG
jgi:hypothetical protein